jgi:heterodisulfide reductase subunit C
VAFAVPFGTDDAGLTEPALRQEFLAEVEHIPGGRRISRCLQCGTCTGSCPVSYAMDLSPREVIARFRAGDIRSVLASRSIWLCASCYACTTRCPVGIKVTDILYALKRLAADRRLVPGRYPPLAMAGSFVAMVRRFGRNHEPLLLVRYFLLTGFRGMLAQLPLAWALLRRGRLPLLPRRIRGMADLRRIIAHAERIEMAYGDEVAQRPSAEVGYGTLAPAPPPSMPVAAAAPAAR